MNARTLVVLLLAISPAAVGATSGGGAGAEEDLAAARALFDRNLDAIRNRDRNAYLSTYLQEETLSRTGPDGPLLGYEDHAAQINRTSWPDAFEASDIRLIPVRPGVVYATYRYRVLYGRDERTGLSERVIVKTDDGWRIAVTSAFDATPEVQPAPRALVGATLIDGVAGDPIPDSVVVMRNGLVECAGPRARCEVPEGVDTLDISGMWITPGLIDSHVHFSQTGWADGRPDALDLRGKHPYEQVQAGLRSGPERWFRSYLCSGVTAVFDVGGYPWTWGLRDRAERGTMAPHVQAAGPLLSTLDHWLNLPAERQFIHLTGEEAARGGVDYLAAHGSDAVKVWFIAGESIDFEESSRAVMAAGERAREAGIPLIVHATELREAKVALDAGAHLLVHSVWDKAVDQEFIDKAKKAGTIYCPTLTVADGYQRMFESIVSGEPPAIDDPGGCVDPGMRALIASTPAEGKGMVESETVAARGQRAEERRAIMAANLKAVHDAGIPVAMGTDAGNPLTLHGPSVHAEMEAMQAAGLGPAQVLHAATRGGALAMRRADLGKIEAGAAADLLVLSADPTVSIRNMRSLVYVVRGGRLRKAEELKTP